MPVLEPCKRSGTVAYEAIRPYHIVDKERQIQHRVCKSHIESTKETDNVALFTCGGGSIGNT